MSLRLSRRLLLGLALAAPAPLLLTAPAAHASTFDLPPIDRIVHYHPKGMARAALALITGGRKQGASTITQQLVRTMLLTRELTVERKAKEILLAFKVEEALSKDRILEIYLNEIFLGQRAYGFAAAAQTYFGKSMDQLTIAETALLAGLPQNPYYANPVANMARATARQRVVLQRMHTVGVINDAQLRGARRPARGRRPRARTRRRRGAEGPPRRRHTARRHRAGRHAEGSARAAGQRRAGAHQGRRPALDPAGAVGRGPWSAASTSRASPSTT